VYCEYCQQGHNLPQGKIVPFEYFCPLCGFQVLSVTSLTKGNTWNLCPWCWNHPPDIVLYNSHVILESLCHYLTFSDFILKGDNKRNERKKYALFQMFSCLSACWKCTLLFYNRISLKVFTLN
jgi:hypothetical protein